MKRHRQINAAINSQQIISTRPRYYKRIRQRLISPMTVCSVFLIVGNWPSLVLSAPTGGSITGGAGSINQSGTTTTIEQTTQNMALDWQSYNVDVDERVNYIQPNASAISLNRILSNSGSEIRGRIDANGQVILVNPNGVFFTQDAVINVGGIIASGLHINTNDFMNGYYIFNEVAGTEGTVINRGTINASVGGNVALLGKQVKNEGLIAAKLGSVSLAAGKQAVLSFDGAGLLGVQVSEAILQDELGLDPAVVNSGEIQAQGGQVLLTASVSQDVFTQAVNSGNIEQATSVVVHEDGSFTLGDGADVVNSGDIDVSDNTLSNAASDLTSSVGRIVLLGNNVTSSGRLQANAQQGNGGEIELHAKNMSLLTENSLTAARSEADGVGGIVKVLGERVGLLDQTRVDVSGDRGGGTVLIGGDYQGNNPQIRNAQRSYVGRGVEVQANALTEGNGGQVITWSDDYTGFEGRVEARGGTANGDGGLVEISGKGLSFNGEVDVSAPQGAVGTLLFDPLDIVIADGTGPLVNDDAQLDDNTILQGDAPGSSFIISEAKLESLGANANIVLEATNNITLSKLTDGSLDLRTANAGSLTITADADSSGAGDFFMDSQDTIQTQGGSVTISGENVTVGHIKTSILNGNFNADGGAVTLNAAGTNAGSGALTVSSIDSQGVTVSNSNGNLGGNVTLTGNSISVGLINSAGANALGNNQSGGAAGDITVTAGNDITILPGGVSANGGNGPAGVDLDGNGGDGGNIRLNAGGDLTVDAAISSNGGSALSTGNAADGGGGDAGQVTFNAANLRVNAPVTANGGNAIGNDRNGNFRSNGGNAGGVTLNITNSLTLAGNVSATGGAAGRNNNNNPGNGAAITINGSNGENQFNINNAVLLTGASATLNGLAGGDTLLIRGASTNTTLSAADRGQLDLDLTGLQLDFNGIENLTGGDGNDTFTFELGSSLSGLIDGGAGVADTVDMSALNNVNVELGVDVINIEQLTGNNINSTLTGSVANNAFVVNGENDGSLDGGLSFTDFNRLNGGDGDDTFTFQANGRLLGLIDGGNHSVDGGDVVNMSALTSASIELGVDVVNVEQLTGNNLDSTLIGTAAANTFVLNGQNDGDVDGISFTDFNNLSGGNGADTFTFQEASSLTGLIDGGGQGDSVNMSALLGSVTVELGVDIQNIEQITGNNTDSTLVGTDLVNTFVLDGENDGNVDGVNFTDFNKLNGKAGNDTFTVQTGGSLLNGVIDAGAGDDTLQVTLAGQSGQIDFQGGADNNNILLQGGGSAYQESYTTSGAGGAFLFTDGGNNYDIKFSDVSSIQDNVNASLSVLGTATNDTFELGINNFVVNNATVVNYLNKRDLAFRGLGGGADVITLLADVSALGMVTLSAESVVNDTGRRITSDGLTLDTVNAAGTADARLLTNVNNLFLADSGTVYIDEQDQLTIAQMNATGEVDIRAVGTIDSSAGLISDSGLTALSTNGNITLDQANQLVGPMNLSATFGTITLANSVDTDLANVSANNLNVTVSGNIDSTGAIGVTGTTDLTATGGDIVLSGDHDFFNINANAVNVELHDVNSIEQLNVGATRVVNVRAETDLGLGGVTGGTIQLDAGSGQISDTNGGAVNLTASQVTLRAVTGIGSADALETQTTELDAINTTGAMEITNTGSVTLSNLVTQGDINFINTGNVTLDNVDAGFDNGTLGMSVTNGSIFGVDRDFRATPDITANNAVVNVSADFGTPFRPISVKVKSEFTLLSNVGSVHFFGDQPPPIVNDNSTIKIDIFDAFLGLSGQQLIAVETLSEVDPAIFTEVRNYYLDEISILLPADQRYDDEDEDTRFGGRGAN